VEYPRTGKDNPDAKAALIGRLMMRKLISTLFQIDFFEVKLKRTPEGKPYWKRENFERYPRFNFNISHHGSWVVLASEPYNLVGVDIMTTTLRPDENIQLFFNDMKSCFTPAEWNAIRQPQNEQTQLVQFFKYWTLKESYIKATGIGLGLDLQSINFYSTHEFIATENDKLMSISQISIQGYLSLEWVFDTYQIDQYHLVSVGLGSLEAAIPNYKNTFPINVLTSTEIDNNMLPHVNTFKHSKFNVLTIQQLLP